MGAGLRFMSQVGGEAPWLTSPPGLESIRETLLLAETGGKKPRQPDPALDHCNLASSRRPEKGAAGEDSSGQTLYC